MGRGNSGILGIPPYEKMLWPTLQAIRQLGDSGSKQEIEDMTIEIAGYSEAQEGVLHGAGPRTEIQYRLAWARSYLKKAGALDNSSRGVWQLTDLGKELKEADIDGIPAQVRAMFSRKATRKSVARKTDKPQLLVSASTNREETPLFTSTVFEEWRDNLLDVIQQKSPASFEKLCQRVLRESGFIRVDVTGKSGDGGIDGIGVLRIALLSFHVFFQCKRYKGSVGASAIRDFRGAMVGRTDKGLFITTGSFTRTRSVRRRAMERPFSTSLMVKRSAQFSRTYRWAWAQNKSKK
jgi:restriction system protein